MLQWVLIQNAIWTPLQTSSSLISRTSALEFWSLWRGVFESTFIIVQGGKVRMREVKWLENDFSSSSSLRLLGLWAAGTWNSDEYSSSGHCCLHASSGLSTSSLGFLTIVQCCTSSLFFAASSKPPLLAPLPSPFLELLVFYRIPPWSSFSVLLQESILSFNLCISWCSDALNLHVSAGILSNFTVLVCIGCMEYALTNTPRMKVMASAPLRPTQVGWKITVYILYAVQFYLLPSL